MWGHILDDPNVQSISNKDITLTSILGVEVSRCNDLTKEQLEQVFDYLVEKELE